MQFQNSSLKALSFADMNLSAPILTALEKMRVTTPTPIQSETVLVAQSGLDLVGVAQTGSGKTLAYALSILSILEKSPGGRALILAPSRETAEQVHRVLKELCGQNSLSLSLAATGVPQGLLVKELKKNPRMIVATPGRLVEQLQSNKLLLKGLEILVIDEADRMLSMGFEPQLKFIQSTLRGTRQTLMFAATFGPWAEPIAKLLMKPDAVLVRSAAAETPVETLDQTVYFLTHGQKQNRLLDELKKMKNGVIVFADSQESCVTLGRLLGHHGFSSDFVHGDMTAGHRNRIMREFREEKLQILVTTDLLARGLDVPHVKYVINFDLPYKAEDFLHRIGRTARAGREGSALTFVTPSDGRTYRKIKGYLKGAVEITLSKSFQFDERG